MTQEEDGEDTCLKPCDPDAGCEECAGYWARMEKEGLWHRTQRRWTDKGWREIIKR